MNLIISWCPGQGCDPCKVGNIFVDASIAVMWHNWDYPTYTPINFTVTITAHNLSYYFPRNNPPNPNAVIGGSFTASGSDLFPGGGNSSWFPKFVKQAAGFTYNDPTRRAIMGLTSIVQAPSAGATVAYGGPYTPLSIYELASDGSKLYIPYEVLDGYV